MRSDQLIYLAFGKEEVLLEARYAVLTTLARNAAADVLVCTDQPQQLADWPVRTMKLTPEQERDWRGPHNHGFRMKIAFLLEAMRDAKRTILVDVDTIMLQNPTTLFERITPTQTLMCCNEYAIKPNSEVWGVCETLFSSLRTGGIRRIDGSEFTFSPQQWMWNAGVVGVHSDHRRLIEDALVINDHLYEHSKYWYAEQLALSLLLSLETQVVEANDVVEHYWSRIHYPGWRGGKSARTLYNEQAVEFFVEHHGQSIDAMIQALRANPPRLYRISPFRQKVAAVLRRTIARQYAAQSE